MSGPEDIFAKPIFEDPANISEMAQNDIADIFNQMQAGFIPPSVAKEEMDKIEAMRAEAGDGWFDRYGPPPPELDDLFEGEDRYWESTP